MQATVARWIGAEPDDDIRAELVALRDGPSAELAARFAGTLTFGTAGLRAEVGAGPLRMNRLVVRAAAAGAAEYVMRLDPAAARRGVVIGHDVRHKSAVFALDTARVLAARGLRALLVAGPVPTPIVAWAVPELDAAAGIVVTASHNPPRDNGYKVYLGDGAQIAPPHDAGIAAEIAALDPTTIELAPLDHPLVEELPDTVVGRYLAAAGAVRLRRDVAPVPVAYTPMHGVGGAFVLRAFEAAALPPPLVVAEQFEPDGAFPTVAFPNPEEPGAMDRVIALASSAGAAVAIANDPDADRVGAAIPRPDGSWRRLGGDELGWLLADHVLRHTTGDHRLVVTTLVSSSLLRRMAADHGVHFLETYTGFKWIARAVLEHPGWRLVFAYEQALGYLVAPRPLDKDGITTAVVLAEIAAVASAEGVSLQGRLDAIAARYGRHVIVDRSIRMDPFVAADRVRRLQAAPPATLNGASVVAATPFPEASLLRLELDGGVRVQVRPSGTEPKVKLYGEAVDADPAPYLDALAELLTGSV